MSKSITDFDTGEIKTETVALFQDLKDGWMPGIAYDTAWMASHSKMFPKSLDWILNNQKDDGSWGCEVEYYHDRLMSTLAAVIALSRSHKADKVRKPVEKGVNFLWKGLDEIKREKYDTIGFELLLPAFMEEAEKLHLNVPTLKEAYFEKIKEAKLNVILKELVYSGKTTLSFSAEFLGPNIDITKISTLQNPNGSVGNSPSATAYLLHHVLERKALAYLDKVYALNRDGSIMAVYPFEIFEKSWVIYHFITLDLPIEDHCIKHVVDLKRVWTKVGTGISKSSPLPDSDDTAIVFKVLSHFGENLSPKVFEEYEGEENFICFKYERDPSVSTNIHILDAIKAHIETHGKNNSHERWIEKILAFLKSKRINGQYWIDKWHVSPYYATCHAVVGLCHLDYSMAEKSIEWILNTQNPNGSWGYYQETLEETAYALWALLYWHENVEKLDESVFLRGIRYLTKNYASAKHPELWIAKGLYCPLNVVKSAVLSVLYKFHMMRASKEIPVSKIRGR
jgi:halimadienyl-diphosphate synthase